MESVLNMLRPLHFVFVLAAFAFFAFAGAVEAEETPSNIQTEIEGSPGANTNDLEADASYYWGGYARPYRYAGYGRGYGGYGRGYGGYGGYGGGYRGYGGGWGRPWGGRGLGGYWG